MRIDNIYVEYAAKEFGSTQTILNRLAGRHIVEVENYQDIFSRQNAPYLSKRVVKNLHLAVKRGALIREAPPAYGFGVDELHYYHIHAYNCIYECEYCYLQGYFRSPDLVLFVNHADIITAIQNSLVQNPDKHIWFHAGEFSDSLALSHLSGELPLYWNFFSTATNASLELRTKSVNLRALMALQPLANIVTSYSLSTFEQAAQFDHGAPRLELRLRALAKLAARKFPLALHFDPIIFSTNYAHEFETTVQALAKSVDLASLKYISLGVVRFGKDVYKQLRTNYPDSQILARHFIAGEDQKMRYIKALRLQILETSKAILKRYGCPEEKIYFCME